MQTEIIELSKLAAPKRAAFGEFLVMARVLDRFQLFRALQLQDRMPGERLGQCAVALGYVARMQIEHMHAAFASVVRDAELETMETEAFEPVVEEIVLEP
ncbi:MAG TPA: hypothetical protein VMZ53_02285 [Kofleriaceae bacterium]|nr:hypothetical protein [Kofleriaceae bacterium]